MVFVGMKVVTGTTQTGQGACPFAPQIRAIVALLNLYKLIP